MTESAATARHVLLVEDAIDQALLVRAFFANLPDLEVVHSQDGDRALELIGERAWDLLVTDLNLPGTDGFTLIRVFRRRHPDAKVVVITGYTQPEYEEQALRAGADRVMIKPLNGDRFVTDVGALLLGEREGGEPTAPDEADAVRTDAEPGAKVDAGPGAKADGDAAAKAPDPAPRRSRGPRFDADDGVGVVLAVEGRLGDAEMGCGGALRAALDDGRRVVVVPILVELADTIPEELKGSSLATGTLGVELRVDRTLFGDADAQRDLLERTLLELRPTTLYVPAPGDLDAGRRAAAAIARAVGTEVDTVLGYQTATTAPGFTPTHFLDVTRLLSLKMKALAAYQSVGAARVDLRPRMAQAYARYWGRFADFSEVEAFARVEGDTR